MNNSRHFTSQSLSTVYKSGTSPALQSASNLHVRMQHVTSRSVHSQYAIPDRHRQLTGSHGTCYCLPPHSVGAVDKILTARHRLSIHPPPPKKISTKLPKKQTTSSTSTLPIFNATGPITQAVEEASLHKHKKERSTPVSPFLTNHKILFYAIV